MGLEVVPLTIIPLNLLANLFFFFNLCVTMDFDVTRHGEKYTRKVGTPLGHLLVLPYPMLKAPGLLQWLYSGRAIRAQKSPEGKLNPLSR